MAHEDIPFMHLEHADNAYNLGWKDAASEIKSKIQSLHKGDSNDLTDKGWNEAIEYITNPKNNIL